MGGLKPIGSEKLEGMDKIHRIMEIARYKETLPNPINESEKNTYSLDLADGNTYHIVKERLGYIIKKGLNESTADYVEPMKNRKYFSSYSQALKKLNLMAKEFNVLFENVEGTSLFNEEKKKYKLKLKSSPKKTTDVGSTDTTSSIATPPTPAPPTPAPMPEPEVAPTPSMTPEEDPSLVDEPIGSDMTGDLGVEDIEKGTPNFSMGDKTDTDDEPTDEEPTDDEESTDEEPTDDEESKGGSSFKLIQKLTGKLAQKIRSYTEDNDIDSKDAKYILNSILSAIDVDSLDDDDVDDIIARLEGEEDEDEDFNKEDGGNKKDFSKEDSFEKPESGEEDVEPINFDEKPKKNSFNSMSSNKPKKPSMGELGETMSLPDAINKKVGIEYGRTMRDEFNEDLDYTRRGARFQRKPKFYDDSSELDLSMFGESKVDKIISKYFDFSDKYDIVAEKSKIGLNEQKEKNKLKIIKQIENLSENLKQKRTAVKFIEKYPDSKFIGKTNKGNLIFNSNLVETKITINGTII